MTTYPLIRTKWTNEHVMSALWIVLVLYNIPQWIKAPPGAFIFFIVCAVGLISDAVINFFRFKRMVCAVSAAVTSGIVYTLVPQLKAGELILGAVAGIAFGKHVFGGTGKNALNPAITGFLFAVLIFKAQHPVWEPSWLMLPALILSFPFLIFRPFAGSGFMLGMLLSLLLSGSLSVSSIVANGIIFLGCVVLTDPVTITAKPYAGGILGLVSGFIIIVVPSAYVLALTILLINIVSFLVDRWVYEPVGRGRHDFILKKPLLCLNDELIDIAGDMSSTAGNDFSGKPDIFEAVKRAEVFGQGGAGFPTWIKLDVLNKSERKERHLIINAVECDPGLIHDKWLLLNRTDNIFDGIRLLKDAFNFTTVTLAAKDGDSIDYPDDIKIFRVPDFYPSGAEKILIRRVLGLSIGEKVIPAELGILVLNLQTVLSVHDAVCLGKKADTRYITAANLHSGQARVIKVRLGEKINKIMEIVYPKESLSFVGGGIMQSRQVRDDDIIDKNVNFIAVGGLPKYKESPQCSKCSRCAACCPQGLEVYKIAEKVDKGDVLHTRKYHAEKCIGCGSCSYVCLAGRNLAVRMKIAREYCLK